MMRKLILAGAVGLLTSVGAMLVGENQPGFGITQLVVPGRPPSGFDLYIFDHYFIVDSTALLLNVAIFGSIAYGAVTVGGRFPPRRGAGV